MLLLDRQSVVAATRRGSANRVQLRLRADGQLVELPLGKTTIGSSPRCTIRIQKPGIEPVHCLIVHGSDGLTVRRWATDTQLNGAAFDDASFEEGDCLALAGVELELVASQPTAVPPAETQPAESVPQPATSDELLDTMQESVDAMAGLDTAPIAEEVANIEPFARRDSAVESDPGLPFTAELNEADAAEFVFRELQAACATSRGRSRKLLSALRTKQAHYNELLERFSNVDQQLRELNRLRAGWERANSSCEVERREWESRLSDLRQQVGEWESRLAEQAQRIAEIQQELVVARLNESPVAMPCEAAAENMSPSTSQVFSWLPPSGPAKMLADDSANIVPPSTTKGHSVDAQPLGGAEPYSTSVRKSISTWGVQSPSEAWSAPDRTRAESTRGAIQRDEAVSRDELVEADVFRAGAGNEQAALAAESTTSAKTSQDEKVAGVTSDENPFAELSIWKQDAVSQEPGHEDSAVGASIKPAALTSIWGSEALGETAEDSADIVPAASLEVIDRAAAQSNPWVAPAEVPLNEVASVVQPKAQPTSFIERYSHLFAEDEVEGGVSPTPAPQPLASSPQVSNFRTPAVVRNDANHPSSLAGEEEESIEQYMAKLLERVRGDGPVRTASQAAPAPSVVPEEPSAGKSMSLEHPASAADEAPVTAERAPMSEDEATEELATWEVSRRKATAPASATDMGALRALANQTTRRAISKHQWTKRRNAVTKLIVSSLAGMTSLWLMLLAPNWRDILFIAACVSLMVVAYWAGEAFRSLLESMRAAAYDGPEDHSHESESDYCPAMPIDVEDRF